MFQSYNEAVITNESDEATINCWCQEIPVKDVLEYGKKHKKDKWYKRLIKWLRGKR